MLKFEYECWKCPEWHSTTARGCFWGFRNGFARPALRIGGLRLTIPAKIYAAHLEAKWARDAKQ